MSDKKTIAPKRWKSGSMSKSKELPKRDITSFVTKQMLSGNISILKIPRMEIESALERYCEENTAVDVTKIPLVGVCDKNGSDEIAKTVIALAKKYCGKNGSGTAIFSEDGHNAIIFGKSAKEIVSNVSIDKNAKVEHLKTKIKTKACFPLKKSLKCFGGERISDYIKTTD